MVTPSSQQRELEARLEEAMADFARSVVVWENPTLPEWLYQSLIGRLRGELPAEIGFLSDMTIPALKRIEQEAQRKYPDIARRARETHERAELFLHRVLGRLS